MTYYYENFTGTRYRYGLHWRPAAPGAIPTNGLIVDSNIQTTSKYRYGTIDYGRRLSQKELYDYELIFDSIVEDGKIS